MNICTNRVTFYLYAWHIYHCRPNVIISMHDCTYMYRYISTLKDWFYYSCDVYVSLRQKDIDFLWIRNKWICTITKGNAIEGHTFILWSTGSMYIKQIAYINNISVISWCSAVLVRETGSTQEKTTDLPEVIDFIAQDWIQCTMSWKANTSLPIFNLVPWLI